ncbi:beta-lactamase family protein [Aquiflexum sp. LQ15W]|uniref:serine hydrolase domain-containing protein n=1 Tax=Cognataquiflexum nitidum TaxID=2922272 RepID=UPI001F14172C|nr:beta-lactamase family protein [Cognataquiflexum nitidum]MCH6202056.1 beta-lactamase family protein [Cognataquiflexum nitidum]
MKFQPIKLVLSLFLHVYSILYGHSVFAQVSEVEKAFAAAEAKGFSGVLLLAVEGKIVFEKAAGYRSYEQKIPLVHTDVFEMASVSKQFTAMMVMMCAEKGLLDYNDYAEKYLDIPYKGITIKELLSHTNGLPDYQAVMDKHWDKSKVAGNEAILEYLRKYHPPMLTKPGEKYEYSNTAYVFLASIVEKVTGKDFIELSREWIFRPLEMTNTDIRTLEEKAMVSNFAAGHLKDKKGNYVNTNKFHESDYTVWLGKRKGPGRISSTAQDLLIWDQALYSGTLVSDNTLKSAFSPQVLNDCTMSNYGFGWDLSQDAYFGKIVSHTGDNPGYKTLIMRFIDQNKTLILLNNNAHESKDQLIKGAVEALREW